MTENVPHCYRHPDRETHIRCQRCDKSICPDCMREAAVGFQCPDCVKEGSKATRQTRAMYGGERSGDPRLTSWVLIAINIAVWAWIWAVPSMALRLGQHVAPYCEIADQGLYLMPTEGHCLYEGGTWIDGLATGAWWQAISQMFSHEAIWHLAMNMVALALLGPLVESALGRARFLAVYLVAGLSGGLCAALLSDATSSVLGASGAIWGLMGTALVLAVRQRAGAVRDQMLQLVGLNVLITVIGYNYISWQGHLGGFIGGSLAAAAIVLAPQGKQRSLIQWSAVALLTVLVIAGYLARALTA